MPLPIPANIMAATPTLGGDGMPGGMQQPPAPAAAPGAAPMATPEQPKGLQAGAATQVQIALKLLERVVPILGSSSDQGRAVLTALKTLSAQFPHQESNVDTLVPAEMRQMANAMQQRPPASPMMGGGVGGGRMPPFQGL